MGFKRIFFIFLTLAQLSFFACAEGPYSSPMGNWGHMMGYGYGGGFMWIIFLIVIVILIFLLVQIPKSRGSSDSATETPLDILKKRYARGEIDKEEFDRTKKDLES